MRAGCLVGRVPREPFGMGLFVDERGYTTIAVATTLLLSVTLVFCVAATQWGLARSADVQSVADAAALAGSNAVAAYCTVAQALDACTLSLGLAGMASLGAGLVLAAVPGAQEASAKSLDVGKRILDSRNSFGKSSLRGLKATEKALPGICAANAYRCVKQNAGAGVSYAGVAVPFPTNSQSDFGALADDVQGDDLVDSAQRLQDATERVEEAKKKADELRKRAWMADCVDDPRCMRSRAQDLCGLFGEANPMIMLPEEWTFGDAICRSRNYYGQRLAQEAPLAQDIESVTDSMARRAFFEYALGEVNGAWYSEDANGYVDLYVPHLARNSAEVRQTYLYTDAVWPCTEQEEGVTLHSTLSCPGATGSMLGYSSVAAIEEGSVCTCPVCGMSVGDLGRVASISTSATNGYEHYWQIVVEVAQAYQQARNDQADAERAAKDAAEQGSDAFDKAMEQLRAPRPKICPPGAWGCVAVVGRARGSVVPSELTQAFLGEAKLGAGAAVSASALATDSAADGGDVLSHLLDGFVGADYGIMGSLVQGIGGLWGRLLTSYGSGFDALGTLFDSYLGRVDGLFGASLGRWLKRRVVNIVETLGLQPADMRMRKPVLTSTSNVLQRAGYEPTGKVRQLVQALPAGGDAFLVARALGVWIWDESRERVMTLATLEVPGTGYSVPLTLDLSLLGDGGV